MSNPNRYVGFMLAFLFTTLILLFSADVAAGEMMVCATEPGGGKVRWLYRILDSDGRRCWLPAEPGMSRGEQKPREELTWMPPEPERQVEPPPEPEPTTQPPWSLEPRWLHRE